MNVKILNLFPCRSGSSLSLLVITANESCGGEDLTIYDGLSSDDQILATFRY